MKDITPKQTKQLKLSCLGCIGYLTAFIFILTILLGAGVRVFNWIAGA